jgi:hypothetical protein
MTMIINIALRTAIAAALLGGCAGSPDVEPDGPARAPLGVRGPLAQVAWLTGAWETALDEQGNVTEEHWTPARAGTMFGANRLIRGEATAFFEYLRIEERDGGLVYLASPAGRSPATPFTLVPDDDPLTVVFENPEHDFPQRIMYTRVADGGMVASIEGTSDGREQRMRWEYRRVD